MTKQDDSLFLLEVLIDKIVFVKSPCFSDKDFRTCVKIECNGVEPLEICDDDPGACAANSGGPFVKTFNNGKSCLFSLKEADITTAMNKFPVKISVYKSLPCGCLPTKIVLGESTIDMTKEFVQARKKFLEDPSNVSYQALKDSFRIIGSDGQESGEIVMFMRISCFGKLIVTRFQGTGGAPQLSAPGGNAVVDRSCNPARSFQTSQDPCVCGAARGGVGATGGPSGQACSARLGGGGAGPCPIVRDPYNSMPCEDPDDPCYCSGPRVAPRQQMECRNTDKYCLHVPKGTLPRLPYHQDLTEAQKHALRSTETTVEQHECKPLKNSKPRTPTNQNAKECILILKENINFPLSSCNDSLSSINTLRSHKHSEYISNSVAKVSEYESESFTSYTNEGRKTNKHLFGKNETTVYMTLYDDACSSQCTSGTQATASINKCLQVNRNSAMMRNRYPNSTVDTDSNFWSASTTSALNNRASKILSTPSVRYQEVYFFGKKKEGMGSDSCQSKKPQFQSKPSMTQTKKVQGTCAGTTTGKTVSIDKKKCPAAEGVKGDNMIATVSHIKIGPREPCPVHNREPCQGPKCIVAGTEHDKAPVKVTTSTNPRRGVFELVIRRMTGAPLAKNELMLEWTPPPSRAPPCGMPCSPTNSCRPSKCKMIVCRPLSCKAKCCRNPCKKPCGRKPCGPCSKPCRVVPCMTSCLPKRCWPCPTPRAKCRPCPPLPSCRPCPPPKPCPPLPCKLPCPTPCCHKPCPTPCKSSPCLRPCPVGRGKRRRARSQPKFRAHRKLISPCLNRTECPVIRCQSMPSPCLSCCLPCPPRKSCSVVPCRVSKYFKSICPKCC